MEVISNRDVEALSRIQDTVCLSLYLPAFRSGPEVQQNSIRFKNMLARATELLHGRRFKDREVADLLSPLARLQTDKQFWEHQMGGLALFRTPRRYFSFCVPVTFEENVVLGRRLHLKPLFSLFSGNGRFYALALGSGSARLYLGTRYSVIEALPRLPAAADMAPGRGRTHGRLQLHTIAGTRPAGGPYPGVFHGQGEGKEREKEEIARYYRRVDRAVSRFLREERAPLVSIGLEYLCPIYRGVSSLSALMDKWVDANAEELSAQELHAAAWKVVEPSFKAIEAQKAESFRMLSATGKASPAIQEIVPAAVYKRVETLFLADGRSEWGRFDRSTGLVTLTGTNEEEGEDLLDLAAVHTLKNGGTVFVVSPGEVPGGSGCAALFRY